MYTINGFQAFWKVAKQFYNAINSVKNSKSGPAQTVPAETPEPPLYLILEVTTDYLIMQKVQD